MSFRITVLDFYSHARGVATFRKVVRFTLWPL
jgi:hypothetical protein